MIIIYILNTTNWKFWEILFEKYILILVFIINDYLLNYLINV